MCLVCLELRWHQRGGGNHGLEISKNESLEELIAGVSFCTLTGVTNHDSHVFWGSSVRKLENDHVRPRWRPTS